MHVGYSWEDIQYRMTIRGFHARLMAAYALLLEQQRDMSRAVALGVGRLFAKGDEHKKLDAATDDAVAGIAGQIDHILGGGEIKDEALRDAAAEARVGAAVERGRRWKELTEKERFEKTQKMVRKLDIVMTKMTGRLHQNPLTLVDGGQPGMTPFDLHNTSINDLLAGQS